MRILALLVCASLLSLAPGWCDGANPAPKPAQDLTSLSLEQLMEIKVEGAALHPQSLSDAPASVTILTAEDIRKFGYRTLGEALSSVRGFYANYDRTYHSMGVRGFNLPGDYASRFLVMVDGHNMADSVFDEMLWFGVDFPIEMNLVNRIEVIRGPSSALYGSNGILATINIITNSPDQAGPSQVAADVGSFGEKKVQVMTTASIGRGAKLLFSGSVFNNGGESPLYFPEFNSAQSSYGQAIHMDGEKGYHFFSNLEWRHWSLTAVFSDRNKTQPISWGPTVFNDPGTRVVENRNYVEAAYTRERDGRTLRWRAYYDGSHLRGRFHYALDSGDGAPPATEDNRSCSCGDWVGTELSYRFGVARLGALTVGGEGRVDLRTLLQSTDVSPAPATYVDINRRDRSLGLFVQDERQLSRHWKLDLGLRVDVSAYRHSFVSPRAAFIYQPSNWTYKFLYGRAFRNPNAFDLFFDDGLSAVANPALRPEKADTVEVDVERKIGKRINLVAAAYGYRMHDFLVGVYTSAGLLQRQNLGKISATGVEIEINSRPADWLEATASYAIQRSRDNDPDGRLENSPGHLAKLRFAVPVGRKLTASSGMQYYSSRRTLAGNYVGPVYLADFTVTSRSLFRDFDFQFGIRNALNRNYYDPIALTPQVDAMRQPGRSFFVELIAHAAQ